VRWDKWFRYALGIGSFIIIIRNSRGDDPTVTAVAAFVLCFSIVLAKDAEPCPHCGRKKGDKKED